MKLTPARLKVLVLLSDGQRRRLHEIASGTGLRRADLYRVMAAVEREAGWVSPGSTFSEDPFYGLTEAGRVIQAASGAAAPAGGKAGYVVLSGSASDEPSDVEFVHPERAKADAERRRLSSENRSRRFVTRPTVLREVTP